MTLDIAPATDADYAIIANLARFYVYDMAEHAGFAFPADGLFDAGDQLGQYWGGKSSRPWPEGWRGFAFLIRVEGLPAGFALVKQIGEGHFDMGEFFIGRMHRRKRLGQEAAASLFDRFQGQWDVREMLSNVAAQAFWRRIIAGYTNGDFTDARESFAEYGGREFLVQRFRSRAAR
jgi:predicted acetyltransferase